jgi:ketosteroid isomerase-like protein
MRLIRQTTLVACLALSALAAADGPQLAADPLLALEAERFRLTAAGNVDALATMLAEDLSYCHSNGKCESKAEYIGNLRSGSTRYRKLEMLGARVRRHGNIAIVNGRIRIDAEMAGTQVSGAQMAYTDVYRRERGAWRLIAWHSSRLP